MNLGLTGKNVIVTGAGRGLGRELARAFSEERANLYLVSRDGSPLEQLRSSLASEETIVATHELDLSDPHSPETLVARLDEVGFHPDVVIHNLGGTLGIRTALSPTADWHRVLWHNCLFAAELNRLLMDQLRARPWARLVHISSASATSLRGSAPYACAKALLNAYITTLGRELAQTNVVVSGILPGAFRSEGGHWDKIAATKPEVVADFLRHHQAVGRLGDPREIVAFALLLGSELNTFGQGALVNLDGGTM